MWRRFLLDMKQALSRSDVAVRGTEERFSQLRDRLPEIERSLSVSFNDKNLLLSVFVHCSFYNEAKFLQGSTFFHNERLEFLGDSVLGLLVSKLLYLNLREEEGVLSKVRAEVVNANSCAEYAKRLSLESWVLLGKGEQSNQGRGRLTILADTFEALVGAIYLDQGLALVEERFLGWFEQMILLRAEAPQENWKAALQDYSQRRWQVLPCYHLVETEGPEHNKQFIIQVSINGTVMQGVGRGSSKKLAEQQAACVALKELKENEKGIVSMGL